MSNFIQPSYSPKERISTSKEFIYKSYENDRIVSPYDGEIVDTDRNECEGKVLISHKYNGETLFTTLCGVKDISVVSSQRIKQGGKVGEFGDDSVRFTVKDKSGNKKDISKLISGVSDKEDKKEPEKIKTKSYSDTSGDSLVASTLADLLKVPGIAAKKLSQSMRLKKKPKEDEPEKENPIVFEEIRRIKELMK